jgi:CheY-like chemotaxis protein
MSSKYLHYLASVSQYSRRRRQTNRLRNKVFETVKIPKDFNKVDPFYHLKEPGAVLDSEKNKKSILVAESDTDILSLLEVYLNSMGYDYDTVNSGDKVLDYVLNDKSSVKKNYDIVLLDTHLKELPGLLVANEIRKRNSRQRIMIMSTTPRDQLPYELIKSAMVDDNDVFTKPFRLSELLCSIER